MKTKIAYEFARKFGENAYLDTTSYRFGTHQEKNKTIELLSRIMDKIEKEKNSVVYQHFIQQGIEIPIWAATTFFDFGTVRSFYVCLDDSLAFNIANYYKVRKNQLIAFLSTINMYRNVSAHNNRIMRYMIYNRSFSIMNTPIHKEICLL